MNWKLKAHTLAVLSRIPYGHCLYGRLQQLAGTNRVQVRRDLDRAFELVGQIRNAGVSLSGADCLEIGTGWHPFVPYVLALAGARRVETIDVNPWLSFSSALETWNALQPHLEEIAAEAGVPISDVRERYAKIPEQPASLSDLLGQLGIDYVCPGDARSTDRDESSVDIVLSSNVLEHIPRDVQQAIHQESLRILKPGGLAVHRFNPQDHFSTVDGRISHANFLRFSQQEWHWLGGSGLAYHNRLRSRDYRELFESTGFEIDFCRVRTDDRSLREIRAGSLPVHADFAGYSPEELAVDYMWMTCRKPVCSRHADTPGGSSAHSIVPLRAAGSSL